MALSAATRRLFAAAFEKPALLIPEKVIGYDLGTYETSYNRKDAQLYAAAVGASADPMNKDDLDFTWEMSSDFKVLPTFGVTIGDLMAPVQKLTECEGMPDFNLMLLLHGEEKLELHKPFPAECEVITNVKIADVADKGGKAALLTMENTKSDKKTGDKLSTSTSKLFIRGIGGFGYKGSTEQKPLPEIPEQLPKYEIVDKTAPNQAIIYRLCSDLNPLHINPQMAALGGFDRPILHGLCSYGYAARNILTHVCKNDVTKFKDISARFTSHVFPGETLVTSIWKDGNDIIFAMKTQEREQKVVCMGKATIEQDQLIFLKMVENRRIQKEWEDLLKLSQTASEFGVSGQMVGNEMTHWKGIIKGPHDTPYQGGTFIVDIKIPPDYPYKPPKMQFDTKIWHPNISSQTGVICLDILKDEWSPALTIRTALLSLQALLCNAEPDDPQDAVVAQQYKNNREEYNRTAAQWTGQYAKDPNELLEEKVKTIAEMGFEESVIREALNRFGGDAEMALNSLLNG